MKQKDFVMPDFSHSVVNIATTLAQFLGKKPTHATLPKLAQKLNPQAKNLVYLVIDGMGARILEKNLPITSCLRQNQIDTVTSVFPSTTTAATTSLMTGLTPAEHGWFAWSVDCDGEVVELFRNRNFYTHEFTADPNFAMHHFPYEKFFDNVTCGREIYSCFPENISTKINTAHIVEFRSLGQMFRRLHQICRQPNKKFIYSYYAELDSTMHGYGTTARRSRHLLRSIEHKVARLAKQHPDTIFVITADHGQTDVKGFTYLFDDANLQACLAHPISLDPRGACFKIKPGMDATFKAAFQKYVQDFTLFATQDLIKQGIFGDFKLHPTYQKHLGDYIAIGGQSAKMMIFSAGDQYQGHKRLYHGTHTGLTADEMMVPVIVLNGGK